MKYRKGFSDFTFGNHNIFKLNLMYGTSFSIYKNGFWNKNDDFEKLTNDFKDFIEIQNTGKVVENSTNNSKKKIDYVDFFQTQNATILFYLTIVLSIFALFMTLT